LNGIHAKRLRVRLALRTYGNVVVRCEWHCNATGKDTLLYDPAVTTIDASLLALPPREVFLRYGAYYRYAGYMRVRTLSSSVEEPSIFAPLVDALSAVD